MVHRLLFVMLMVVFGLFLVQCSDDDNPVDSTGPDTGDTLIVIDGITETDDLGYIIGGDLNDWCYDFTKNSKGPVPSTFALYPAFPNASYYYINLIYDLPLMTDVYIRVIDSTAAVVRDLVDTAQVMGQYVTGWNLLDTAGVRVAPGMYRVLMNAGDFECQGDIEVLPVPEPDSESAIIYTEMSGDNMLVSYDSPEEIAALWLVFISDGDIGTITYDIVLREMSVLDNIVASASDHEPDTLKVIISTPIQQIETIPSGEHGLCIIPITGGRLALNYTEASNEQGQLVPTAIVKLPEQ